MIQDAILIENKHKRFIKNICKSETVYGLENKNGFATSSSIKFDNENGEPVGIICFWAEKALAKSCIKKSWSDYKVTEIILSDFIENWCIGMNNDELLVGTEFDQNMLGYESEPLDLILEIANELKELKKDLNLKKFNGINDIERQVKSIIE